MPLVIHGLDTILFFPFIAVLIGACLSKVLLMKRKEFSKPRFVSLFSLTNDQSSSHNSVLNAFSLKSFYSVKEIGGFCLNEGCLGFSMIKN